MARTLSPLLAVLCITSLLTSAAADGPADNHPDKVRRVPRLGINLEAAQREKLKAGIAALGSAIESLRKQADNTPLVRDLLPDVEIYYRAVHDAVTYQEFFKPAEVKSAERLLEAGLQRAAQLGRGEAPWTTATGLVVRGFVSKLDGSVQPYGLIVPPSYTTRTPHRYRLDIWFHGRGETLSEVNFLTQRSRQRGVFAPTDTIVLHPYGRYSNAFKFAGEVDVLEALESVKQRYRVDEDRTSVRGFSMGGAACWQFAVHYSDRWFAANPGAGFSETPQFLKFFQKETLSPTWYERKLWRWYDCNLWSRNLVHCPTVAYSGENDIQKQAADVMEEAMAEHGLKLVHLIGPKTGHRYHPAAAAEVERRLDSLAKRSRSTLPRYVTLTTYTLKYNRMHWVTVEGLQQHWERTTVHARATGSEVVVRTRNVTDLTFEMPPGTAPLPLTRPAELKINDQAVGKVQVASDRSWTAAAHLVDGKWRLGSRPSGEIRKRHDLQGPIDDAFMDSFLFVRPTGKPAHAAPGKWAESELERAIEHWRRHFRGHARVKKDVDVTDADIGATNLVLWGDPSSNQILGRIADRLPIRWTKQHVKVGDKTYPADSHALIAIYPNPENPNRYVVLNSGFTYREYAYLNNARQVAKLPDWAVIDLRTPPDTLWPGKVVDANFFNEQWQLK